MDYIKTFEEYSLNEHAAYPYKIKVIKKIGKINPGTFTQMYKMPNNTWKYEAGEDGDNYDQEFSTNDLKKWIKNGDIEILKDLYENLNEALEAMDRVKLKYPKHDNDNFAKALNGKTGYIQYKGDDKNMWYVKLDSPVDVDGITVSSDQWDKSYLKKIK